MWLENFSLVFHTFGRIKKPRRPHGALRFFDWPRVAEKALKGASPLAY